ncbi:MAG: hypothetical protein ACRDAF_12330, partial [Aeromonas veronii]
DFLFSWNLWNGGTAKLSSLVRLGIFHSRGYNVAQFCFDSGEKTHVTQPSSLSPPGWQHASWRGFRCVYMCRERHSGFIPTVADATAQ